MLIDLTVPLNENTPVYPGDPLPKIDSAGLLERDGYTDHLLHIGTHLGTHMDAPSHMIAGGKNLNDFPLAAFTGRGVCINGLNVESVQQATIKEGDIVFLRTGMSERYGSSTYFTEATPVPESIVEYLIGKKIKMLGVDMGSVDQPPFPVHKRLLTAEILIIENLTNLEILVGKMFRVHAYPLKLALDGSPVRVIAELP